MLSHFSHVQLFGTLWTIALQAPLSMGFSKQEYWSGLAFYPPRDLLDTGMEPTSPMSQNQGSRTITGWFLPRRDRHSVLEYPEDSYWEGAKLKDWWRNCSHSKEPGGWLFHSFFGSDNAPVLSVFRHNYKGALIVLNHHYGSSEWPHNDVDILWNHLCTREKHQGLTGGCLISSAPPWPWGMDCPWREPGGSQNGTGRCQKQMFFSDPGCLCRGGILRVNTVFLSSISMISNPHLKRKRKKREKNQWLRLHEATLQFFLYRWWEFGYFEMLQTASLTVGYKLLMNNFMYHVC